jgi:hypothetical protein
MRACRQHLSTNAARLQFRGVGGGVLLCLLINIGQCKICSRIMSELVYPEDSKNRDEARFTGDSTPFGWDYCQRRRVSTVNQRHGVDPCRWESWIDPLDVRSGGSHPRVG